MLNESKAVFITELYLYLNYTFKFQSQLPYYTDIFIFCGPDYDPLLSLAPTFTHCSI